MLYGSFLENMGHGTMIFVISEAPTISLEQLGLGMRFCPGSWPRPDWIPEAARNTGRRSKSWHPFGCRSRRHADIAALAGKRYTFDQQAA